MSTSSYISPKAMPWLGATSSESQRGLLPQVSLPPLYLQVCKAPARGSVGRLVTVQFLAGHAGGALVASGRALELSGLDHRHFTHQEFAAAVYLQSDAINGNIESLASLMRLHLDGLRELSQALESSGLVIVDYLTVEPAFRGNALGYRLLEAVCAQVSHRSLIAIEPAPIPARSWRYERDGRAALARHWGAMPGMDLRWFGEVEKGTLIGLGTCPSGSISDGLPRDFA